MPPATACARRLGASGCLFVALVVSVATCSARAGASTTPTTTAHHGSRSLSAPKTSFAQDTKYFTDVTEADPALVTYEQQQGNVALRALLTDGSAFCAFVRQGGGIDRALVSEATGVRSTESTTHLPLSITTFNAIEAVALLTLCPSEQRSVPTSVRSKIRALGTELAHRSR
jgi:hypothetical protein